MRKNEYDIWIKKFMEAWKELDYKKVLEILDLNVEYYENPIDKPCSNFNEVEQLWNIISDNQKDISYEYKILSYDDNICIVNWRMTRTLIVNNVVQSIDGIFQISINDIGKCTYFKQWRYTR